MDRDGWDGWDQLTCYAVGALVSLGFLIWVLLKRRSNSRVTSMNLESA